MAGQINKRLVRQFRMPGYPMVMVTTDLLQEGEDLHTFCSAIHHYGISWTPSSMEQRVGRIDRVRSQTERRLLALKRPMLEDDKLQVYLPHLRETVEVLQVRRVLERMNTFLKLMHEGLVLPGDEERKINIDSEIAAGSWDVPQIKDVLQSPFSCQRHLAGESACLAVEPNYADTIQCRFARLKTMPSGDLRITWEPSVAVACLLGTATLGHRIQPFTLLLKSFDGRLFLRCISPVGRVSPEDNIQQIQNTIAQKPVRIGAIPAEQGRTYDLTVEADLLLPDDSAGDSACAAWLIRHVTESADSLEQSHLPGKDETIAKFRTELEREARNEA